MLDARLYFVSSNRPGGRELTDLLPRAIAGGVDIFQLRMKDAADEDVLRAGEVARQLCTDAGIPFVLNDRPDLAAALGADGVHLGQDDMPVAEARTQAPGLFIGRSTHSPDQIASAGDADYFAVGPVYLTPTKPGRPAVGLGLIRHAASTGTEIPWFAIGGIEEATVGPVVQAGARRIVAVRAIAEAPDPERAAAQLRAQVDTA